jgi:hypothetical protein
MQSGRIQEVARRRHCQMDRVLGADISLVAALSEAAWYNIGLVVVVAALIVAGIMAYRVYGEVNEDVDPASPEEVLAAFEQARAEGELDEEEYERVRRRFDASLSQPPDSSTPARKKGKPD